MYTLLKAATPPWQQIFIPSQNSSSPDQTEQDPLEGGPELRDAESIDGGVNEGVTHKQHHVELEK